MMPDLPNVGLERDIEQFIVSDAHLGDFFHFLLVCCSLFTCSLHILLLFS